MGIHFHASRRYVNYSKDRSTELDLMLSISFPAQSKVDKKRDKLERKVLDSQERAFWDVFRPMPNCINTTEVDIKKAYRKGGSSLGSGSGSTRIHHNYSVEQLTRHVR